MAFALMETQQVAAAFDFAQDLSTLTLFRVLPRGGGVFCCAMTLFLSEGWTCGIGIHQSDFA